MSQLRPLMERNFIEYASYVIIDRAIPELSDGCKPVQRRILNTLFEMDDGRFHKVANVIGETMKLHPHGDRSIGDALVVLANKEYFIERQGNYGSVLTGHDAAAPRYIECRLTDLARETLFNPAITHFTPSYDGRKDEPTSLPAKLPILMMLGTEGIAVGMATRILPHNFCELLQAQVKILNGESPHVYPDFPQGGLVDVSEYEDGAGKVRVRARIEIASPKRLVIREIPYSTTTARVISSIEAAAQKGRLKISNIDDFTTDHVEIELTPSRGVEAAEVLPQLYAYTDCELTISSSITTIRNERPVVLTVSEYLRQFNTLLKAIIKAELQHELSVLEDRQHWLTLEQIFIENRVYKRIESAKSERGIYQTVNTGMMAFAKLFVREITEDDIRKLVQIPIRRISMYDIDRTRGQIDDIVAKIKECRAKLKALTKTTIEFLEHIVDKYGDQYPRRTEITPFEQVDRRAVARANIRVSWDSITGFFGSAVRGNQFQLTVSEYDRILAVTSDGTYRVISPPEKLLLPGKLLYCSPFDKENGVDFTLIYRDADRVAWGKRIHISGFITDKVYDLVRESSTGMDFLTQNPGGVNVRLRFVPGPRQRLKHFEVNVADIKPCGTGARGSRLHAKPVASMRVVSVPKQ